MSPILSQGAGRRGPKSKGIGTRLSLQTSSLLLPTAQVPCHAVPSRAKPWHPARPCHRCTRNFKGVSPPEGEEEVEDEEEKAGKASTAAGPIERVKPCLFPLCPRPGRPRSVEGVGDVPQSWWPLVTSVSASHTLRMAVGAAHAPWQVGKNSLPTTLRGIEG